MPATPPSSLRRTAAAAVLAAALVPVLAAHADVSGQLGSNVAKDHSLSGQIGADNRQIDRFQGRLDDLRARLAGLQQSVDAEESDLHHVQDELRSARARLARLRLQSSRDDQVLARQLVGQYETPRPDIASVLLGAHGFAELLERANGLKAVAEQNASFTRRVRVARAAVTTQARQLADLEVRQSQVTQSALTQRDEVDEIRIELVKRQYSYRSARAVKAAKLQSLRADRGRLRRRLAALQATAARSVPGSGAAGTGPGLPPGGAPPFVPHGGSYGLFLASGTNYGPGDEPRIAARLDLMGKALHLHLIGISGFRTPQHSVEVGGFANDPHTRGEASDTPGLEGVPEGTLNRYGLTRPFGGAAEADHVQLVGSA